MLDPALRDKTRIAQQFSRAASTYDLAAAVQLDIAFDAMAKLICGHQVGLDIGCGTGRITQQLAKKCDNLIAMDLAKGMLDFAQQQHSQAISWLQGDAENLPIANDSVDLVFSSMVLQWAKDQNQALAEIARVMKTGSTAMLAIMCQGSFEELNASWKNIDDQRHVNHFASADSWLQAAQSQGLKVYMQQKQYQTWHANIRELLGSVKSIGANVLVDLPHVPKPNNQPNSRLNRNIFKQLEHHYQQNFAVNMQLPLTYQVCFLHCSK